MTLSLILSTAPIVVSTKSFVKDLDARSTVLQDVNEQFRIACEGLTLVSFFEAKKTSIGPAKIYIVEKESAILGHPLETSSSLDADHHNICKFKNPEDSSYVSVRNTLKLWASMIRSTRKSSLSQVTKEISDLIKQLGAMLEIREPADVDLNLIRSKVMKGTCQWMLDRSDFTDWIKRSPEPGHQQTFWLIGLPAMGKTALASTVVDHIHSIGQQCQYHFFSASHQVKRNASYCLRSIAAQLARSNEEFRQKLLEVYESTGVGFKRHKQNFDLIWETVFEGIIFKMKFPKPLVWILDAVDEVDSHQPFLGRLFKIHSASPIKLFITSRPIRIPSAATAYASDFAMLFLSEKHTYMDMRTFVQAAVQDALPDDETIQEYITVQILEKSSGSFLWTKLAIEMLQDHWHTQDDILKILTGVPVGMESLYSRMLDKVMSQPPRLQLMARRILTWVACSWRPLHVDELRIALEPEFKNFVKLEDTIVQICGHFISVDQSRVSLIHITAQRFLLDDREGMSAFIDKSHGHEHIAVTCLKYLANDAWSHKLKAAHHAGDMADENSSKNRLLAIEQIHPFTIYPIRHWAYHVSKSTVNSQTLKVHLQFFLSRYCLSWVEAIALSGNLHYLTRSAKYLKVYGKRLRNMRLQTFDPPMSFRLAPEDFSQDIHLWATDFIRIVGKFGHNLVQLPSSIHRLIPPFCPSSSMIGKTNGRTENQVIALSGLPCRGWDDCLAAVSVGEGIIASKVLATDAYFFVLVSGSGTVTVWHSETCEEARRLRHGEYVPHMVVNKSGNLLATAGMHTYRVWDVCSGEELHRFSKATASITMAMAFGNRDSELLIGLDDCSVMAFDLNGHRELWHFSVTDPSENFHGCPRLMNFSPDLTKIAVAWRCKPLLVLDIAALEQQQPRRCRVTSSTDAMCAPESVVWQNDSASILVLCQNGNLVEWRLYEDERIDFPHITAREITISLDGSFLLTSDNLGTLSVWTFPRLNLIYQLTSTNEFVRDLAFSPDGQRFYDTRQSTCNIWEPDALVRPDEYDLEDHSSVGDVSIIKEPVISHDEFGQISVTALTPDADGKYYCCGREDGTVTIHEAIGGKKLRKLYGHTSSSSIITLSWSPSGRYMVSADDSGRVISKRLGKKAADKWSVFPALDLRLAEPVEQFLFDHTERLLLISTSFTDVVYDLKLKKEVCRKGWDTQQSRRWSQYSGDSELLLRIDPTEVCIYGWTTLSRNDKLKPYYSAPARISADASNDVKLRDFTSSPTAEMSVCSVITTEDNQHIFCQIIPTAGHSRSNIPISPRIELISISDPHIEQPNIIKRDFLKDLSSQVKRLIGIYHDSIVFLDHDYWLCTWKFKTESEAIRRHFFLPRDWLN